MKQVALKDEYKPDRSPLKIEAEFPLTEEEFLTLNDQIVERATGWHDKDRSGTTAALRLAHQEIARLAAAGFKGTDIAQAVGYSLGGVYLILKKPATQALIAEYAEKRDNALEIIDLQLRGTAAESLEVLRQRVRTKPEEIKTEDLRKITEGVLDRIGKAPIRRSVQANINTGLSPEDLEEIKAAVQNGGSVRKREITLEDGRDYQVVDEESGVAGGSAEGEVEGESSSGNGVSKEAGT